MIVEEAAPIHLSWPVYGHHTVVSLLQRTVAPVSEDGKHAGHGGPRHAYLFLGPRHVGKTTVASTFARALLCTHPQVRPCQECRSCRLTQSNNHPDLRLVQPLDKEGNVDRANGMLRVDQATELVHEAALSPVEGRYKLFLIQDMHTANDSFANKLLKTLEEPPEHVVLCVTASDRSALVPTIVSRCQVFELQLLGAPVIEQALINNWQEEPERARLLAKLCGGRLGWAVQRLTDSTMWQERTEQLDELWNLTNANRLQRLAFAEKLATKRDSQEIFGLLELWTTWWRDILLAQAGCIDSCSNIDYQEQIMQQAERVPTAMVQKYIHTLQRTEQYLQHTTNTRLALEVLLLQLPRPAH